MKRHVIANVLFTFKIVNSTKIEILFFLFVPLFFTLNPRMEKMVKTPE